MLHLRMDVFQLTDVFEKFVQTSTERVRHQSVVLILSSWVYLESCFKNDQNQLRFYKR